MLDGVVFPQPEFACKQYGHEIEQRSTEEGFYDYCLDCGRMLPFSFRFRCTIFPLTEEDDATE